MQMDSTELSFLQTGDSSSHPALADYAANITAVASSIALKSCLPVISIPDTPSHPQSLEFLSAAIAALNLFLQTNWTGPEPTFTPAQLFPDADLPELNQKCIDKLAMNGEPAYHLTRNAVFLYVARSILFNDDDTPRSWQHLPSAPLWALRVSIINIRLLDDPVPVPDGLLEKVQAFIDSIPPSQSDIKASAILSLAIYHSLLVHLQPSAARTSSLECKNAAAATGLGYELSGRMGKRTKFQKDEKSQLVLLAKGKQREDWKSRSVKKDENMPETLALNDDTLLERTEFSSNLPSGAAELDSDSPLHPLDQCILLALSLSVSNTSPSHGLTTLQIAAFVTRVVEHPENWSVHSMSLLLRSRLEANRTRTVERGLLQIQSLVDQLKLESTPAAANEVERETGAPVEERLEYIHQLSLPSKWELERELATRYLGLGVVRSALDIFERLEMWEDVARCYASQERTDKAVQVINDLISGSKSVSEGFRKSTMDPMRLSKLHCLLGDLTSEPEHYHKALELHATSARALRGLGGHAFTSQDYKSCITYLSQALAINPLYHKSWFVLGCAAMRIQDFKEAEKAFSSCVRLEEEDGESWSNLATVHLRCAESLDDAEEAPVADDEEVNDLETAQKRKDQVYARKRSAFTCLKQAIRYAHDTWRIWANFMFVAIDVGELSEACRAMRRLVEMRAEKDGAKAVDLDVLQRLVAASTASLDLNDSTTTATPQEAEAKSLFPRVKDLFDTTILPTIRNSPEIYLLYAKLQLYSKDLPGFLSSNLKAYRSGVASSETLETSLPEFKEATEKVVDLVDLLRNYGDKQTDKGDLVMPDWKSQAKSILRTFMGRTKSAFEDTEEWERIKEELDQLKRE